MRRRIWLAISVGAALGAASYGQSKRPAASDAAGSQHPFTVVESSIPAMRDAMEQGRVTSRELVTQYLVRIALYEDKLHAAIIVNSKALDEADALDRERAQHKLRGPLH